MRKLFWAGALLFVGIAVVLGRGLFLNPTYIPSPFIGKPMPHFDLPVAGKPSQHVTNGTFRGHVVLLNVFASWCVSCRQEMPVLIRLQSLHVVRLVGVDYKDTRKGLQRYLRVFGNPYSLVVNDKRGMAVINWGIYGVPETFVVNKQGLVAYKFVGPITWRRLKDKLLPLVHRLQAEPAPAAPVAS
ncbi:MAG: DsbE family thiol:disulfide interchange protein [Gammaproteobacteria bacterium]|nr:DsbE family thiol:disulfide interchange protein [Gammaproteobacteria bacterium]